MTTKFHEERARRIIDFYQAHDNDQTHTNNHFVEQGFVQRTIKRVIKRWVDEGRVSYKWNYGRKRNVQDAQEGEEQIHQEPVGQWPQSGIRAQNF